MPAPLAGTDEAPPPLLPTTRACGTLNEPPPCGADKGGVARCGVGRGAPPLFVEESGEAPLPTLFGEPASLDTAPPPEARLAEAVGEVAGAPGTGEAWPPPPRSSFAERDPRSCAAASARPLAVVAAPGGALGRKARPGPGEGVLTVARGLSAPWAPAVLGGQPAKLLNPGPEELLLRATEVWLGPEKSRCTAIEEAP